MMVKKARIIYMVTNGYVNYFDNFFNTLDNFIPDVKKELLVMTNNTEFFENYKPYGNIERIDVMKMFDLLYPCINLHKSYFLEQLEDKDDYEYTFYFDSDTIFKKIEEYDWKHFIDIVDDDFIVISKHPVYNMKEGTYLCNTRMEDWIDNFATSNVTEKDSTKESYIPDVTYDYLITSFFGGRTKSLSKVNEKVIEMCRKDLTRYPMYHIPHFMDENYFNALAYRYKEGIERDVKFHIEQYSELYGTPNKTNNSVFMLQKNMNNTFKTNRR